MSIFNFNNYQQSIASLDNIAPVGEDTTSDLIVTADIETEISDYNSQYQKQFDDNYDADSGLSNKDKFIKYFRHHCPNCNKDHTDFYHTLIRLGYESKVNINDINSVLDSLQESTLDSLYRNFDNFESINNTAVAEIKALINLPDSLIKHTLISLLVVEEAMVKFKIEKTGRDIFENLRMCTYETNPEYKSMIESIKEHCREKALGFKTQFLARLKSKRYSPSTEKSRTLQVIDNPKIYEDVVAQIQKYPTSYFNERTANGVRYIEYGYNDVESVSGVPVFFDYTLEDFFYNLDYNMWYRNINLEQEEWRRFLFSVLHSNGYEKFIVPKLQDFFYGQILDYFIDDYDSRLRRVCLKMFEIPEGRQCCRVSVMGNPIVAKELKRIMIQKGIKKEFIIKRHGEPVIVVPIKRY